MTRNRKEYKDEPTEEKVLTVDEALSMDRASVLYDKLSEIVKSHGVDLSLKVRLIHSDYRTAGFIDDVTSTDEVQSFIDNPEGYLKAHYGEGSFRIDIIDGISRKYISHLKIDISSPKEKINRQPNPPISYDEISKARKEGRSEILELVNLVKPNTNQAPQPSIDLVALFRIVSDTQDKIRTQENLLREREFTFLKETVSRTSLSGEMKEISELFKSAMGMVNQSMKFSQNLNPLVESSDIPWWERVLIQLGERILTSKPELFDKFSSVLSQVNLPKAPNAPVTANIPLGNNPPAETLKEEPISEAQSVQFNFDYVLPILLNKYVKRAARNEDPGFCADSFLADLDDLVNEKLISESQYNQACELIVSDNLEAYIKNFSPDVVRYKAWIIDFQTAFKDGIGEPQEEKPEVTKQ